MKKLRSLKAFPVPENAKMTGMELRDYFAAKAMQIILAEGLSGGAWDDYSDMARSAYNVANAMLEERAK